MALGFIKKVFSFGNKDVEQRPAEDEPLAPLNFDALREYAAETAAAKALGEAPVVAVEPVQDEAPAPSPLRGGSVSEADRGGVVSAALDAQDAVEEALSAAETTPSGPSDHLPLKGGETAPQPAPEIAPDSPTEIPPPPAPSRPAPVPPEVTPLEVPPVEPPHQPSEVQIELPTRPVGESSDVGAAPHPPVGTFSPYRDGEKEATSPPPPYRAPIETAPLETPKSGTASDVPLSPHGDGHEETPSAAETTPSGPADHLPLEGGESLPPLAPSLPLTSKPEPVVPAPTPAGKVTVGKAVEAKASPVAPVVVPPLRIPWFQRLREGLARSSRELTGSIAGIFTKRKLDEDTLEELEDVLIRADLGMETAIRITDTLSSTRYGKDVSDGEVRAIMAQEIEKVLAPVALPLELDLSHKPHVILVVGVNGTGKTTTIGKLAAKLTAGGLSVMLAAGDTFRAAAIEQLKIWGERTGSPVVSSKLGADAAGLAWDAFEKAREAGSDVLIIDTAGRLQNKAELMSELEKIVRVLGKHDPDAPHTVLQTVDATTGQNALNQVEIFRNVAGVSGLVMTKLDGTARGGILVAIAAKHKLPVYFIGVGEQVDDLEPFSASDFAKAIAGIA